MISKNCFFTKTSTNSSIQKENKKFDTYIMGSYVYNEVHQSNSRFDNIESVFCPLILYEISLVPKIKKKK